jgi:ribosomal-protein-alanine N-acetyltransferase
MALLRRSVVPLIHTRRLALVVPDPSDAERMLRYATDNREHLAPWEPIRPESYFTLASWRRDLAMARPEFRQGISLRLILLDGTDLRGPVLGTANFRNIVRGVFQACHLGYSLDHRKQGQGLMREALEGAINYAFKEMNLHRIMANHMPANDRSARLLVSLGFQREGLAKDYLMIAGAWRDHILTSLVNPAWQPLDGKR